MSELDRPPQGIMPRFIWEQKRLEELRAVIERYAGRLLPIHADWIEEYNELVKKIG